MENTKENPINEKEGTIFGNKIWDTFNIMNKKVYVVRHTDKEENGKQNVWFCAYVVLPKSEELSNTFLSYPTLREGTLLGVDTNHGWKLTEAGHLASALNQITSIIEKYRKVTEESYYGEEN